MPVNQTDRSELADAVNILKKSDPQLAIVIDRIGICHLERGAQGLTALVYSIIGQQLSRSAAQAIRSGLDTLLGNYGIDPEKLMQISDEELRKTGLSQMKARYLHDLARRVLMGEINFQELEAMDDEAIIETLSQVKGIGRWTAEMYLMFSLRRLDVFPIDDSALRRAMIRVYDLREKEFHAQAIKIAERWQPFRTIACWYLYAYLDMSPSDRRKAQT